MLAGHDKGPPTSANELQARIEALESALAKEREALAAERAALAAERALVGKLTAERDQLRSSHERLRLELELLKKRIFVAKAERVDTQQLELEFAMKLAALTRLDEQLAAQLAAEEAKAAGGDPRGKEKKKPKGRRDLRELDLPEERIELPDPVLEEMVARGAAERIGFEESCKLGRKRGGLYRIVIARAKYRIPGETPEATEIATAPIPAEPFRRSLAAPSLIAHIIVDKFGDGLPLHRIENRFAREGVSIDRGTMARWMEDAGATLGATIVAAARAQALLTAFCIATDATGVAVQPERRDDRARQACRRANYFVLLADLDHVFFEFTPKETSRFVATMLHGFEGYVQADAKSVYDVLFVEPEERRRRLAKGTVDPPEIDDCVRKEVACWSHARRGFWEATVAKDPIAREGLARIGRIFALEEQWRGRSAIEIRRLREEYARPHLDSFFAWAAAENEKVAKTRGLLPKALGYVMRHKEALMRYLEDGRLVLDNNRSERALRAIAVGRKNWLFVGSDEHGESAGHLLSLIASCRLHDLDPEAYLRDVLRVLAHWPRDRYLELAPKYWCATRARLDTVELEMEIGPLTVPPVIPASEEQPAAQVSGG